MGLMGLVAGRFARVEPRCRVRKLMPGLLSRRWSTTPRHRPLYIKESRKPQQGPGAESSRAGNRPWFFSF